MWDRTEKMIFLVAFVFIALFTEHAIWNPNDMSRMAGVESIVERGTFAIDNSTFVNTIDKVKSGEHYYSDKPAISYLLVVPHYFLFYHLFDLNFAENRNLTYYLITLFSVGLGISIMLVYFYRLLKHYKIGKATRIFYTASMFICTLVFPYSLIYSAHGLTAALLPICFYLVLKANKPKQFFLAGLLAGFTSCIDMVAGSIFTVIFFIFLFRKNVRKTLLFIAGAAILILLEFLINFFISGSIIPFNINPQLFDFSGSAFGPGSLSGVVMQPWSNIPGYAFDLILGKKGFILFTPVLIFSIIGLIIAFFRKEYRKEAIMVCAGIIACLIFYITRTNNYGGCSYGLRWTVPLIPLLYLFTPVLFERKFRLLILIKIAFIITLVISAFFAFLGAMEPWTCTQGLMPRFLFEEMGRKFSTPYISLLIK